MNLVHVFKKYLFKDLLLYLLMTVYTWQFVFRRILQMIIFLNKTNCFYSDN